MKIEDKVIELIDYEEYLRQCKLEGREDAFYPAHSEDKKFFIYKLKEDSIMLPVYKLASKPIPKEEQYVVDILHTNILDDMVFLTICNNIDFTKVNQKSLKLCTEDKRLSYCCFPSDNLIEYTARTAKGYTTVIRVTAEKNLIPLLPFLTKLEFTPIIETILPD